MIEVQSRHNPALRHLARLGRERKYRRSTGEMLCEGEKMLREALSSGAQIQTLLVRAGREAELSTLLGQAAASGAALYTAPDALFALASEVETPQSVVFSCRQPVWTAQALNGRQQVLLLDGLQDPGNLGTILRTAEAFALGAVVLCEGCADPFSPKVVRSTMGAVFRCPVWSCSVETLAALLETSGLPLYGAALRSDTVDAREADYRRCAVAIGSEGRGLSREVLDLCDKTVRIPMSEHCESLNAAAAAAVLLWEAARDTL